MRPTEFRAGLQGSYIIYIYIERYIERVRERGGERRERGGESV